MAFQMKIKRFLTKLWQSNVKLGLWILSGPENEVA